MTALPWLALAACDRGDPAADRPDPTGDDDDTAGTPTGDDDDGPGTADTADTAAPAPPPTLVAGPTLATVPEVPLSRWLTVETDVPTTLEVHLAGPGVDVTLAWPTPATRHEVPLHGAKPDRDVDATVTLRTTEGGVARDVVRYRTDPLPTPFPRLDVLAADAAAVAPGYVLIPLESKPSPSWIVAVDPRDGAVAYLYTGVVDYGDVRLTERGTFLGLSQGAIELSTTGEIVTQWYHLEDPKATNRVLVPWSSLNHEIFESAPGELTALVHRSVEVPLYPTTYTPPDATAPATLMDGGVVTFAMADGAERASWWLSDVLDPRHIGWNSLNPESDGLDWAHVNAVIPGLEPGKVIVSARHLDVVFQADAVTGELDWALGHRADWERPWRDAFLALVNAERAPLHQHGPSLDAAGNLVLFDNGNEGHTPYEPAPPGVTEESSVSAWDIDPTAGTATRLWSWRHPTQRLFSGAMGNATALPTGQVVACYCYLEGEDGVPNRDHGWGRRSVRVVELDPARPAPLFDLRLTLPRATFPEGAQAYRAVPSATLYPAEVAVTFIPR